MILRKPYAFFIKSFKVFHLIIFLLASFLLYRTSLIYNFMKEFCKDSPNVIGKDLVGPLFVWWVYVLIIIILLVNIIIIIVMIKKVKPYTFYVFNISLYIGVLITFIVSRSIIGNMQTMLVAARTTLAIRDITNIARLLQTVSVIFYLIRATGFDIKKFDFVHDLQGMDISPEDSEEIEVAIEFEGNVILRKFKKKFRDFKYYYKENRFIINIGVLFLVGVLFLIIYFSFNKYDKIYSENEFFNASNYNIGVKSSYILTKDYFNKSIIDSDHVLVVALVSANSYLGESISTSRTLLVVNGIQYYPIDDYSSELIDLGSVYSNQALSTDFSNYLFVYKIPRNEISSQMIFRFIDNVEYKRGKSVINSIDVRLNPNNLDSVSSESYSYSVGDSASINSYNLSINSYDINSMFVNSYNYCVSSNECYDFREILKPSVTREHDKVLLKINGVCADCNLYSLISKFGSIEYVYNGKSYSEDSDFNLVVGSKTSESNVYYIEVNKEIMDASSINLSFNFRNVKYSYVLRGDNDE